MRPLQMPHQQIVSGLSGLLLSALAAAFPQPVHGSAQVEGEMAFVRLEAHDASLDEVLAALGARLGLRIRAPKVPDQSISGTFKGPLHWVIGRLLAGRDYVAKYSGTEIEIFILDSTKSSVPTMSAINQTSVPTGSAAQGGRSHKEAVLTAIRALRLKTGATGDEAVRKRP